MLITTVNGGKGDYDGEIINDDDDDDDDDDDVRNDDDFKTFYFKLIYFQVILFFYCVHETQINNLPTVQQLTSNQ